MNHLHGKSNSGEGGESLERLTIGKDGRKIAALRSSR